MTRDEWIALPPALALGIIYDNAPASLLEAIESAPKPKLPLPPKWDTAIYGRDGIQYASEMDVRDLDYHYRRALASAEEGGKYAEKDAKQAKALSFWLEWRRLFPAAAWSGERNHQQVTARVPAGKAPVYERENRRETARSHARSETPAFDDDRGGSDDDIPF